MGSKREYEEKQRHGTLDLPVGLHKLNYPEGTDIIFYLHWHQEFEFLILTKGEILFTIEDREYRLSKGDCVFINSNMLHSAKTVNRQACSFIALDFSYEALDADYHSAFAKKYIRPILSGKYIFEEFLPAKPSNDTSMHKITGEKQTIPEISEWIQGFSKMEQINWQKLVCYHLAQISRCPEHELEPYHLFVKTHLLSIWNEMYTHGRPKRKNQFEDNATSERLAPVVKYMKENYAYEISLAQLAQLIPMSEGQFCRVFKQNMKMSPMQYLLRYRILQSCHLLQETEKKIGEIANLTGFNNISYFNKVFLKIIGCTPKEYRNNVTQTSHPDNTNR